MCRHDNTIKPLVFASLESLKFALNSKQFNRPKSIAIPGLVIVPDIDGTEVSKIMEKCASEYFFETLK